MKQYLCEFCGENYVNEPNVVCNECAKWFAEEEDRKDNINRCDW